MQGLRQLQPHGILQMSKGKRQVIECVCRSANALQSRGETDNMELSEILKQLSVFGNDRPVPRQALAEAACQREAITPYLLDAVNTIYQKVQEVGEEVCDDPSYGLSFYALYLLSQFREQRAFPIYLQILTLDEDCLDMVLGDALTETMPNVLYSAFNGDIVALQAVIADDTLEPFARDAALRALGGILRDGMYAREDAVSFFRERLSALGSGENEELFGALLVKQIADNGLYELAEDVREVYRQEKIDLEFEGDFDDFFDDLFHETQDFHAVKVIEDTAEELSTWACFAREPKAGKPTMKELLSWNVGRNDPCPCGSGKKFKKCCLPKKEELELKLQSKPTQEELFQDQYPPINRQGMRPGLSDFYSRNAIEVDQLAYRGMHRLRHGPLVSEKEVRQRKKEAKDFLWTAYEKFRSVCEKNDLKTPEEYDRDHKMHYLSGMWLIALKDLLEESKDPRLEEVKRVLS